MDVDKAIQDADAREEVYFFKPVRRLLFTIVVAFVLLGMYYAGHVISAGGVFIPVFLSSIFPLLWFAAYKDVLMRKLKVRLSARKNQY